VLGAGFTGLAAARRLAMLRPDWRVVVLDAQRVGGGASGRNSGFIVDLPHYDPRRGVDGNGRLLRLGRAGLEHLRGLVHSHAIACDWTERGRFHGAATDAGQRALDAFISGAAALGEPCEPLDTAALGRRIGSSYYRAGAHTPGTVMVQPAALVRGLGASLPDTVELYETSPVHSIDAGLTLVGARGRLTAPRLFVCVNGFAPGLGVLRDRVFPLLTFGSLTRPLEGSEAQSLGGEPEWGLVSEMPMGTTVRRLRDGRMLIRNTVRYRPSLGGGAALLGAVRERHRQALRVRFPALSALDFDHTWGGVMGASFNGAQFFGALAPHLYAAAGYNGVGIAMGTISGVLLADLALGAGSPLLDDMRALPDPTRLPPAPALGIGVRSALAYLARQAKGE
jgi:glycine/D-amino acid oxidase-like deaminating enzyme